MFSAAAAAPLTEITLVLDAQAWDETRHSIQEGLVEVALPFALYGMSH